MSDGPLRPTPLESDLLARFHERFKDEGFPDLASITVTNRWDTGVGRYTYLEHSGLIDLPDDEYGLGLYSNLQMAELPYGANF